MPRWPTPDAAIRDVVLRPPQRARGVSLDSPRTGSYHAAVEAEEAYAQVVALLSRHTDDEQDILKAYALGFSYRAIASEKRWSYWRVWRTHHRAWGEFKDALEDAGLIPEET